MRQSRAFFTAGRAARDTLTPRQVAAALGLGKTAVARLIFLGRTCKGRHPIWGGLWPVFKLGRARRVSAEAVQAHVAHMARLETDGAFAAVCSARAGEARFAGVAERYRGFTSGDTAGRETLDGVKETKAGARMGWEAEERALKGAAVRRGTRGTRGTLGAVEAGEIGGRAAGEAGRIRLTVIGNRSSTEVET